MIAIVDYGVGNLFSVKCSFGYINQDIKVTSSEEEISNADRILLPGVGAFRDAIGKLRSTGLDKVVVREAKKGKPILGVCLGMQLLFERSYEYGEYEGLGLIQGSVEPLKGYIPNDLKIPHMGWNALSISKPTHDLFKYVEDGECVYFVHSYYAHTDNKNILATCEYGAPITATVANGNVLGCQFHPEKSGNTGLNILRAFSEMEIQ